jgi:hypothetical protein
MLLVNAMICLAGVMILCITIDFRYSISLLLANDRVSAVRYEANQGSFRPAIERSTRFRTHFAERRP